MPDWWETENGLDPSDINDGKALADDGSGYTNLELYLNSDDVGKTDPTSIKRMENTVKFSIYPNPVRDYFRISTTERPEMIEIFDLVGVKILELKSNMNNVYSVGNLQKGQYVLRIIFSDGQTSVARLIK